MNRRNFLRGLGAALAAVPVVGKLAKGEAAEPEPFKLPRKEAMQLQKCSERKAQGVTHFICRPKDLDKAMRIYKYSVALDDEDIW